MGGGHIVSMKQLELPFDKGYHRHPSYTWEYIDQFAINCGKDKEHVIRLIDELLDEFEDVWEDL